MSGSGSTRRWRQLAGTLVYDWPRFLRATTGGRGRWARFRNRNEHLTIEPARGGARCEWEYGSELHLANVSSLASRMLFRRAFREWPIAMNDDPRIGESPRVTFVIGHRGDERIPLLMATIASIGGQRHVPIECVVVEQSAHPRLPPRLPSWVRYIHTPIASDASPYNRSWAFNVGARTAKSPLLVLHDNDILVPADYANSIVALHDEGWEMIDAKRFVFYLDEQTTDAVTRSHAIPEGPTPRPIVQNVFGGSFVADRDAYFDIGGFDETYVGWGGEDNEFFLRASTRRIWSFGFTPVVHLWHAPQPEKAGRQQTGIDLFHDHARMNVSDRISELRTRTSGRIEGPLARSDHQNRS